MERGKRMTNEEKIRQMHDTDVLAKFIMTLEMASVVPKKYSCDEVNCMFCKDGLSCYKEWLRKEKEDET